MKKGIGKIIKFFSILWDKILCLFVAGLVLIRFVPMIFGYIPIVCESNSMAPSFYKGDLVYIDKNYDVDSIKKGDIIAFELSKEDKVTHRVYDITENGIITKGDANDVVDISPISKSQIIGENVYQIPFIGNFFGNYKLIISIAVFAAALKIFLDYMSNWLLDDEVGINEEKNKMDNTNSTITD